MIFLYDTKTFLEVFRIGSCHDSFLFLFCTAVFIPRCQAVHLWNDPEVPLCSEFLVILDWCGFLPFYFLDSIILFSVAVDLRLMVVGSCGDISLDIWESSVFEVFNYYNLVGIWDAHWLLLGDEGSDSPTRYKFSFLENSNLVLSKVR